MECIPFEEIQNGKELIYNLLVANYNDPQFQLCKPFAYLSKNGNLKKGFRFDGDLDFERKLAALWALSERGLFLGQIQLPTVLKQDLYNCYYDSFTTHLKKYFKSKEKGSFLCEHDILVVDQNWKDARIRIDQLCKKRKRTDETKTMSLNESSFKVQKIRAT